VSVEAAEQKAPQPQPEHDEPRLEDPTPTKLSWRDYVAIVKRAAKETMNDNLPALAAALAYYAFLAIPSALLVAVGTFSLVAGPDAINSVVTTLDKVMPSQAADLIRQSLTNLTKSNAAGITIIGIGGLLAVWSLGGAMQNVMWAMNIAYDREESRGFVRKRLTGWGMLLFVLLGFALSFGLLVLGPQLAGWIGNATDQPGLVNALWWAAQWPILIVGMMVAFAGVLYLGPNVDHPRWKFLTLGAVVAVVIWLAASGLFALYVNYFGSYNKAWGSLAAVVVMLMWLWLAGLALLFGAEINAEAERSRELRRGEAAEVDLQAPPKGKEKGEKDGESSTDRQ
jgi:membrane protein